MTSKVDQWEWEGGTRLLTVEELQGWGPPDGLDVEGLSGGQESFTALDVVDAAASPVDRLWVLLREEVLGQGLHTVTLTILSHLVEELQHLDGAKAVDRVLQSIEIKRLWLSGEVPDNVIEAVGLHEEYIAPSRPEIYKSLAKATALVMRPRLSSSEVDSFRQLVTEIAGYLPGDAEKHLLFYVGITGLHLAITARVAHHCSECDKAECKLRPPSPLAQRGLS